MQGQAQNHAASTAGWVFVVLRLFGYRKQKQDMEIKARLPGADVGR
jgi:hypothetical protein